MNTKRWLLVAFLVSLATCLWAQDLVSQRNALVKMGAEGAKKLDAMLADKSAAADVRVNAAIGLAMLVEQSGGAFGTAELAKYVADENPAVRYMAYKGLTSPASRYGKGSSLLAEAIKDKAAPIRLLAIRMLAERRENPRALAEVMVNPQEDREIKGDAERAFEACTGQNFGFALAVMKDPNSKSIVPDPAKEKAAIEKYQDWLNKQK